MKTNKTKSSWSIKEHSPENVDVDRKKNNIVTTKWRLKTILDMLSHSSADLREDSDEIQVSEKYQRDMVVDPSWISQYVESVFVHGTSHFDKLHFREIKNASHKVAYEIIEGQQRVLALRSFFCGVKKEGKSLWPITIKNSCIVRLPRTENVELQLQGKTWDSMLEKANDKNDAKLAGYLSELVRSIEDREFDVAVYKDFILDNEEDDEAIAVTFEKINNRTPLNAQELRNAVYGEYSELVRSVARHGCKHTHSLFKFHPIFNRVETKENMKGRPTKEKGVSQWTSISTVRFKLEEMFDQLVFLEQHVDDREFSLDKKSLDKLHIDNKKLSDKIKKTVQSVLDRLNVMYDIASVNKTLQNYNAANVILGKGGQGDFLLYYFVIRTIQNHRFTRDGINWKFQIDNASKFGFLIQRILLGMKYNTTYFRSDGKTISDFNFYPKNTPLLSAFCQRENDYKQYLLSAQEKFEANSVCRKYGIVAVENVPLAGTYGESDYRAHIRGGDAFTTRENFEISMDPWKNFFLPVLEKMSPEELDMFAGLKTIDVKRVITDSQANMIVSLQGNIDMGTGQIVPSSDLVKAHNKAHSEGGTSTIQNTIMINALDNLKQGVNPTEESVIV